jgi:hypothetical protein
MKTYCAQYGITHLRTATSAQNGRAERLHRTLLDKARSMRVACSAPPLLWDDSCGAAAYLTNFCVCGTSWKLKTPLPTSLARGAKANLGSSIANSAKRTTIWVIPGI